jgi:hypothetical protein
MARSEVNRIYDEATKFRAPGSAAVTSAGAIGVVTLDKMTTARGDLKNKLGAEGYEVVIVVETADTPATEEYNFSVEVGAAGSASTVVAGPINCDSPGQFVLSLDAATIEKLDANYVEVELNLAFGDTPTSNESITFSAWLISA